MTITVMQSYVPKQFPIIVKCRNFKNYDNSIFRNNIHVLRSVGEDTTCDTFETIFMEELKKLAPIKEK